MSPVTRAGEPHSQSYVVCLECGKQFEYDLKQMRMGKAIEAAPKATPNRKLKVALFAAIPAVVLGAIWKTRKPKS